MQGFGGRGLGFFGFSDESSEVGFGLPYFNTFFVKETLMK